MICDHGHVQRYSFSPRAFHPQYFQRPPAKSLRLQASDFTEALREQRAASTAALIGRAPVEMARAQKGLDAASAADRILEALLSVEDRSERLAMVPEAFVPPQDTSLEVKLHSKLLSVPTGSDFLLHKCLI